MASVHDLKSNFHIAMHAMGAYGKLTYTNSREAFLCWYAKGMRIFEVDLAETVDRQFVCLAHHMEYKDLKRVGISHIPENPEELTASWFLGQKLFPHVGGGLTPLSLEDLIGLLKQYDDLILMIDLAGQFEKDTVENFSRQLEALMREDISILDRLLIETYQADMTKMILERLPSAHIIYGIDDAVGADNAISIDRLKEMGIEFVSFPWHYSMKYPGKLKEFTENGLTVFSRTIDNLKADTLKKAGVNVILLDTHYETTKGRTHIYIYIYIQERVISGVWFLRLVSAKLMDFSTAWRKRVGGGSYEEGSHSGGF